MAIYFSSLPLALGGLWIAGIPDLTALPVILLSAILQTGYSISLFKAYDRGPLSSVYPVARGSAPLFIFGLSYIFFDPIISTETLAGIFVICSGLVIYGLFQLWQKREESREVTVALFTGLFIALYSITDAYGVRTVGSALSFSERWRYSIVCFYFFIWLFWKETFCLVSQVVISITLF